MIGIWWRIQAEIARGTPIPVGPQRRCTTEAGLPVLSGLVYVPPHPGFADLLDRACLEIALDFSRQLDADLIFAMGPPPTHGRRLRHIRSRQRRGLPTPWDTMPDGRWRWQHDRDSRLAD